MPQSVRAKRHESVFRDNGLCFCAVLQEVTVAQLRDLNVTMGEAMLLLGLLLGCCMRGSLPRPPCQCQARR